MGSVTERAEPYKAFMATQDKLRKNLNKMMQIIDTCFDLKEACLRQRYPNASQSEISGMIYQGILNRKDAQWKSQKNFLKP